MPLSIGDKLGPYEILAPIGAGVPAADGDEFRSPEASSEADQEQGSITSVLQIVSHSREDKEQVFLEERLHLVLCYAPAALDLPQSCLDQLGSHGVFKAPCRVGFRDRGDTPDERSDRERPGVVRKIGRHRRR